MSPLSANSRTLIGLAVLAAGVSRPGHSQAFTVEPVSSRADAVSGGNVLVRLRAPAGSSWMAELDGRNISGAFRPGREATERLALLTGLRVGKNVITIRADGRIQSTLEIDNHPRSGPIFSGPHQTPFVCQTVANGLGPALDRDCGAKTIVHYYYKSTRPANPRDRSIGGLTAGFKPYRPGAADIAKTVTSDGRTVDYVVRREVGVINRAVYEIQLLHRPGDPLPTPWTRPAGGWNGRLVYQFGAGCAVGFRQAVLADSVGSVQQPLLSRGYATATSTLNSFANDCNDRISAETLSMVKEHFIEQFGEPVHTIGWGGSGGSMQVHLIAQNYPGLLDGIIPMASFPDVVTFVQAVTDCQLLDHAFSSSSTSWSEAQKTAVYGFASWRLCGVIAGARGLRLADPTVCDDLVPRALVYDRVKHPKGARCDIFGDEVAVFGRDPRTGYARRPVDNVGVQYGLVAYQQGKIDAERFLELNERIGGMNGDGELVAERTEATEESVRLAYQRGLVLSGAGGLGRLPILDWRGYSDDLGGFDGHARFLSFATRARLLAANGTAANQVMLVESREEWLAWSRSLWYPIGRLVPIMDRWLDGIAGDQTSGTPIERIVRNQPKELEEGCTVVGGERIVEPATYDGPGRCNQLYPSHGSTRIAAGGPVSDDVLKCALRPVSADDYSRPLSEPELERLRRIFPSGVCDFTKPGVGQVPLAATWQRF